MKDLVSQINEINTQRIQISTKLIKVLDEQKQKT
jgi:hypothetical protein